MVKRVVFALFLVFGIIGILGAQESLPDSARLAQAEDQIFQMYIVPDYRPLMYVEDGEPAGFYVELFTRIFDELDINYQINVESFSTMYPRILEGEVDGFPGLLRTPEREDIMYWPSEPVTTGYTTVVISPDSMISSVRVFDGKRLGAVTNDANQTTFRRFATSINIDYTLVEYDGFEELIDAILAGDVYGGIVYNQFALGTTEVKASGIALNPQDGYFSTSLQAREWAIEQLDRIAARLAVIRSNPNSYYHELLRKYLQTELVEVEVEVFPEWVVVVFTILIASTLVATILVQMLTRRIRATNKLLKSKSEEQKIAIAATKAELTETYDKLMQSEKLSTLNETIAGVAHEVNTPISVAYTAVTLLEDRTQSILSKYNANTMTRDDFEQYFSKTKDAIDIISINLKRAGNLIRSFRKVSTDQWSDQLREITLPAYFDDIWHSLSPKYRGLKTSFQLINRVETMDRRDKIVIRATTWAGRISQILINLIDNAIEHGFVDERETGTIIHTLQIGEEDGQTILNVVFEDDGVGIPEENLSKVMEPFFTTKPQIDEHSGLGLPIVYRLLEGTWDLKHWKITNGSFGGARIEFTLGIRDEREQWTPIIN